MYRSAESTYVNNLPNASDGELKVTSPKVGKSVFREPYWWTPQDNGRYSGNTNKLIRFDIPKEQIWDFTTGYISGRVTLTHGNTTVDGNPGYIRLKNGSWNLIERMRHLSNLQPVEEIYPFNVVYNWQYFFENAKTYINEYRELFGLGTQAERNAWATEERSYFFPCDLGFISSGPFPAKFIAPMQSIELQLIDPSQCIETNYSQFGYEITSLRIHAHKLQSKFPGAVNEYTGVTWEEGFRQYVTSGQYSVMFDQWDYYQNAPVLQNGDYLIPVKTAAIQGIYTFFGNNQAQSNPLVNDYNTTFPKLDVSQFFLRVFTRQWPSQPVDCQNDNGTEPYEMYVNLVNAWHMSGFPQNNPNEPDPINEIPINLQDFNDDRFCMVADFRSIRKTPSINPIFNSDNTSSDIRFYLTFKNPPPNTVSPPVGTSLIHLVRSSSVIVITTSGDVIRKF
jgi:hypothetical protein